MEDLIRLDLSTLLIAKEFVPEKTVGNKMYNFNGFFFTNTKMINIFEASAKLQPHGIRLMTDGTYKLILGGYCILITGTIDVIISSNGTYTHPC